MNLAYYLAVFNSTHHAIKFEKVIKDLGLKVDLIPVPREIAASCGMAAKFGNEVYDNIQEIISNNDLNVAGFYHVRTQEDKKAYLKM